MEWWTWALVAVAVIATIAACFLFYVLYMLSGPIAAMAQITGAVIDTFIPNDGRDRKK